MPGARRDGTYAERNGGITRVKPTVGTPGPPSSLLGGPFTAGSVIFSGGGFLLVEDNPNFFYDDANNRLGIGNNTPAFDVDINRSSAGTVAARIGNTGVGVASSAALTIRNESASLGDPYVEFAINGGANWAVGPKNSDSDRFMVTANGALGNAATTYFRLDQLGNVVSGSLSALATNATDGFLYLPTSAGTPTGVPTTYAAKSAIEVDTTNNRLYFYSSGAWRAIFTPTASTPPTPGVVYTDGTQLLSEATFFWDAANDRLGVGTNVPGFDFDILKTATGGTITGAVRNAATTNAASHATQLVTVGAAAAGDPTTTYTIVGAASWSVGPDNSDADRFKIANATSLGTTGTDLFRIDTVGNVVSGSLVALGLGATDGFHYISTSAGTPAGVPTSYTGKAPIHIDTTNNVFYFYSTGAWRSSSGGVPTSRVINATDPIRIDGGASADLSADRTISVLGFGAAQVGVVPASGGGTTNFLRADGTWAVPAGAVPAAGVVYSTGAALATEGAVFVWDSGNDRLGIGGAGPTVDLDVFRAAVGSTVGSRVANTDNTNTASNANLQVLAGGASGGDPRYQASVTGTQTYSWGIDNSVTGDPWKLSVGTALGTTDVVTIDNVRNFVLGDAALATTATDGFIHYPSCAGVPTGVPTAYTGRVPTVVDTTNSRFYGRIAGAWVNLTGAGAAVPGTAGVVYTDAATLLTDGGSFTWTAATNRLLISDNSGVSGAPNNDLSLEKTVAGAAVGARVRNASTSAGSSAYLLVQTDDTATGAADPYIWWYNSGDWSAGIDKSDNLHWKISRSASPSGGSTKIACTVAAGTLIGINVATGLDTNSYALRVTDDQSSPVTLVVDNRSANSLADAQIRICTSADGAGDPKLTWGIGGPGSGSYTMGIDNSASGNPLVIGTGTGISGNLMFWCDQEGNVAGGLGTLATGATDGFFFIPTCAGTPSGTPTPNFSGYAAMIYDSTNNILYVHDGGGWVAV